jgi:hypothetical protein
MNNLFGKYTKLVHVEVIGIAGWIGKIAATGYTRASLYGLGVILLMGIGAYTGDNTPKS